jgi:outer membrane receptor for ferrienterochelin and colicin
MKFFQRIFIISLTLLFSISFAHSQTLETGLTVTVKNQLGEIVPEAEVTLLKADQPVKLAKSNKSGIVRFSGISAGEYQLSVAATGFNNYKSEMIKVEKGKTAAAEATLEILTIETDVMIGGDENVETDSFGTTKVITEEQIAKLPDDPKELEKMLRSLAGESATGEQMPITVDGQTGGTLPPKAAIQQIRVNQNVFSAQYDGPNGGGIEVFTRSSVDKFSGGGNFAFADSRLNATDAFIGKKLPSQTRSFNVNLAGPLGKRASFFMFAGHNQNDSSTAVNAKILNSSLQPVEFKETFATPTRDYNLFSNFSWDPFKKHKIAANYSVFISKANGQNVGGFSLPSRENRSQNQFHNFRISETFLVNDNTVVQSRFSLNYSDSNNFGGDNAVAVNVLEAFFGGGSQNDRRNKTANFEGGNDITWQHKKYGLGFGWKIKGTLISQNSTANFGGTYTFSGRIAPVLDTNNNPVLDSGGNIVTAQIDSLESYRRTLLFRQLGYTNTQIRNLGGGANQFTISGGDPNVNINQYDYAFYQQNSYKISEVLAISFGLRYENQTNISSNLNFSPRAGLIWSPKSDPKKSTLLALPRISVGVGMFYRRFDVTNFLAIEQSTGNRSQYLITDPALLDTFPNALSVDQLQQFSLPRSQRFIDPDLEAAKQNMFSLTASKKLPLGFSTNFTFTYSKNSQQSLTRNINAPLAGTFNPLVQNSGTRPLGNIGNVYQTISEGIGENIRYAVSLNLPEKYVWGNINYSFTKAKNDSVAGSGSPIDPYDFSQEYASANNDGVHRLGGYFFYNLPYKLFTIDANFDIASGSRFNIITGRDTNGDGFYLERPSFATDLTKKGLISTPYGVLDPNPSATDKLIPRNLGRGSTTFTFDTGIGKSFGFGEDKANKKPPKRSLYFNIRVNNVFNVVNRGIPIGNMSSPNFLKTLSNASSDSFFIINGLRSGNGNRTFGFSIGFRFQ